MVPPYSCAIRFIVMTFMSHRGPTVIQSPLPIVPGQFSVLLVTYSDTGRIVGRFLIGFTQVALHYTWREFKTSELL